MLREYFATVFDVGDLVLSATYFTVRVYDYATMLFDDRVQVDVAGFSFGEVTDRRSAFRIQTGRQKTELVRWTLFGRRSVSHSNIHLEYLSCRHNISSPGFVFS